MTLRSIVFIVLRRLRNRLFLFLCVFVFIFIKPEPEQEKGIEIRREEKGSEESVKNTRGKKIEAKIRDNKI